MYFKASELPKEKLPTNRDVIQYFLYLKSIGTTTVKKNGSLPRYIQTVIKVVCDLWKTTGIPILSKTSIRKMLVRILELHYEILKKPILYSDNEWNVLFRVSKCKCNVKKKQWPNVVAPKLSKFPKIY